MLWALFTLWMPIDALAKPRPVPVSEAPVSEAPDTYMFGPGDQLSLTVYRHPDLDAELTIAPDGTITVPLLGRLEVGEKSYVDVVTMLEAGWGAYYTDISVAVNVTQILSRKAFVVGEVTNASAVPLTSNVSVLEALVLAGGINKDAKTDNILLVRPGEGGTELYTVDMAAVMTGDTADNVLLRPGDVLVVPAKTIVNVERFFRRVSGILSPFLNSTQMYRNVSLVGTAGASEDARGAGE
jgi:polysaccharide biosynthesis/export protein